MKSFIDEVAETPGGGKIRECIQCGVCTGTCPVARDMEYPVRKTIAMIRADMREEVLSSSAMWHCLSCFMCSERCPKGVKPAEIAHALESLAVKYGYHVKKTRTPAMYSSFSKSVREQGRVHELLAMMRYYLTGNPFTAVKALPVAYKLMAHKRLPVLPEKSEGQKELSQALKKFREIRGQS
jgi:heterodisulfide reductase subunit C